MKIGRLGVWVQVDCLTASAEAEFARDVEQWGLLGTLDARSNGP